MSHQSTVSHSCWFGMDLWSISSFLQPLLLLLCLLFLLGLPLDSPCSLLLSFAACLCGLWFSRRIVHFASWDVTGLWGPAEHTEPWQRCVTTSESVPRPGSPGKP